MTDRFRTRGLITALAFSHALLLVLGGAGFLLALRYRRAGLQAAQQQAVLQAQVQELQRRVLAPATMDASADRRTEHYLRRLARDLPGVGAEIYNDPDLGNVAEFLHRRLRYAGRLLPDAVVEQMVHELSDYRGLADQAGVLRDYHRFVKQSPRVSEGPPRRAREAVPSGAAAP